MDQGTPGVDHDSEAKARALEHEIGELRGQIDGVVTELDRRRRETFDVRLQLRRHKTPIALAGAGLVLLAGGSIALAVWRHRERQRPLSKARRLRKAVARMIDAPERVARGDPHIGLKILTAAMTAVVTTLARKMTERAATPLLKR